MTHGLPLSWAWIIATFYTNPVWIGDHMDEERRTIFTGNYFIIIMIIIYLRSR